MDYCDILGILFIYLMDYSGILRYNMGILRDYILVCILRNVYLIPGQFEEQ